MATWEPDFDSEIATNVDGGIPREDERRSYLLRLKRGLRFSKMFKQFRLRTEDLCLSAPVLLQLKLSELSITAVLNGFMTKLAT